MKKATKIFILTIGIPILLFTSISLKRKTDIDRFYERPNIDDVITYRNKKRILPLSKKNKASLDRLKKKIIVSKNKNYLNSLKNYEKQIKDLNEDTFYLNDKYIKKENIQKKKDLDNRRNKMIQDKKYLKDMENQANDPKIKLEDIKIKDDIGEKKLKDLKEKLKKNLNDKIKAYKDLENSIKNTNDIKKLSSVKTDNLKPYQKDNLTKQIKEKIASIEKQKQEEKKKQAQKTQKTQKAQNSNPRETIEEVYEEVPQNTQNTHRNDPLEPFSININGQTFPIIPGDQSTVDQRYEAWILDRVDIGAVEKYDGDGYGMWLSSHRDAVGETIEYVNEIIYTDPNGVSKTYVRIGETRNLYPDEVLTGGVNGDPIYDLMTGRGGEYIVFQTCIDDSQSGISKGHIFQKK